MTSGMETLSSRVQSFQKWFLHHGGNLHSDADFVEGRDGRYNVQVRPGKTIKDDAIIVSCPTALTFSFQTYTDKDQAGYVSKIDKRSLSQDVVLRLTLMEQYLLGVKSFWWPYLNILPHPYLARPPCTVAEQPFHTPLYFNEKDMLWLKGTNLGAAARSRLNDWREEFDNAKDSIKGLDESQQSLWTSDLYTWAATIVTTRSFSASALRISGLDSPVLVPGVDLLNHSPHAKVTWSWGPLTCSIQTNQSLDAGNEIFNNYGAKSNEELLMGFGFCLESNEADSFNLSYAPELSQHLKAAKARRGVSGQNGTAAEVPMSSKAVIESDADVSADADADSVEDVKFVTLGDGYHFCPGFLADCSLALQNRRERQQDLVCSPSITRFSNDTLSRNKLHTISSIVMILQQKQMEILKYDKDLPPTPENQNQVYASIYRSSQLSILEGVLQGLSSTMRSITQLRIGELPRIIHLKDVLEGTPRILKRHLRKAVRAGIGTCEPSRLAERGGVKFAFTIWLCGLRLLHLAGSLANYCTTLSRWIDFLVRHYDYHTMDECTRDGHGEDSSVSKTGELGATAQSYANAIQIAVENDTESLFNHEWSRNLENLMWCLMVVREEGMRCPTVTTDGILGEENDKFVIVIDVEDPT